MVYGLLLTWLSVCAFSHMEWRRSRSVGPGCLYIGNCGVWAGVLIVGDLLLFPVLFGVLNSVAWRRWSSYNSPPPDVKSHPSAKHLHAAYTPDNLDYKASIYRQSIR